MTKTIIIAGSKASGKTTLFNYLKKKIKGALFQEEINPKIFLKDKFQGGAFTSKEIQEKITNQTLLIAKKLLTSKQPIIWETAIYVLAYVKNLDQSWFLSIKDKFITVFYRLNSQIIFIDASPQICWSRRKDEYQQRIKDYLKKNQYSPHKKKQISQERLQTYKDNLFKMNKLFYQLSQELPLPTFYLPNNSNNTNDFLKTGQQKVKELLT